MAKIVRQTCECPNCHDLIEFERSDCEVRNEDKVPKSVIHHYDSLEFGVVGYYYKYWYLKCPSCNKNVVVKRIVCSR